MIHRHDFWVLLIFYIFKFFLRNIYESLKSTTQFWRKWHWSLIYYTNTILKKKKTFGWAFWTSPFGFIFIDIPHFDNNDHNFFSINHENYINVIFETLYDKITIVLSIDNYFQISYVKKSMKIERTKFVQLHYPFALVGKIVNFFFPHYESFY